MSYTVLWLLLLGQLHCLLTAFLVSYISSDGHFSEVYIDCLVKLLRVLLDALYCKVTALDK